MLANVMQPSRREAQHAPEITDAVCEPTGRPPAGGER